MMNPADGSVEVTWETRQLKCRDTALRTRVSVGVAQLMSPFSTRIPMAMDTQDHPCP